MNPRRIRAIIRVFTRLGFRSLAKGDRDHFRPSLATGDLLLESQPVPRGQNQFDRQAVFVTGALAATSSNRTDSLPDSRFRHL
jgi:hypothetical protein